MGAWVSVYRTVKTIFSVVDGVQIDFKYVGLDQYAIFSGLCVVCAFKRYNLCSKTCKYNSRHKITNFPLHTDQKRTESVL